MTEQSTILITGAARGLGHSLAKVHRARGWRVLAPGRAELDVADEASIAAYARSLTGQPIDVLVNNAGVRLIEGADHLGFFTQQSWMITLAVNSVAPALITQALLPNLRAGMHRKVLSISSRLGSLAAGGGDNSGGAASSYAAYRVSKTALNQVTRCLAAELAAEGFVVIALSPGWVRTDMGGLGASDAPDDVAIDIADLVERIGVVSNGAFIDRKGEPVAW
ncbi:SDR family NAD(P)-dependent oxidoreductase [Amorphus sp. MBR-141]